MSNFKNKLKESTPLKVTLASFAFWFFTILYLESLLHAIVFTDFTARYGFVLGFSASVAAVLTLLTSFLPRKANFPVSLILTLVLVILYGSQIVYNAVFGTLYALAMISIGGDAVTSFWKEVLVTMQENILPLLALFIPVILLIVLKKKVGWMFAPSNGHNRLGMAVVAAGMHAAMLLCLLTGGTGAFTNYYFYHSIDATTNQVADRFGLITAFRLELTATDDGSNGLVAEAPAEVDEEVEYNVLEIDFDELNTLTEKERIIALNDYCASLTGTNKNEYTGMLSDYNLIVLCAESFATGAIDPVLTPTLYKLANEGIVFNNYYNSYPNTTTDGEYSLCQGLFPDTSRGKSASSFYATRDSYLPYALGNIFMEQKEIQSYGYHNFYGTYYGRRESHTNMGYEMKFAGYGMKFTTSWPASDLEMMEQSVDDYINMDQFHAYYMTFSGHYKYDRNINPMASRNWDAVKDLEYSDPVKCYLSCNLELEYAMAYLMDRLEEAGVADKTAIVLAGDHFPYGLTDAQYSELVGYEIDDFSKYKSTLIFWVGGLEENIVVDEYCCNIDILPTILNLWGFEYDSRMLAGTDVFSDGDHMAILIDKSVLTDKVWFNTDTAEATYLVDQDELPEGYVEDLIQKVQTKFTISSEILNTAYYNFVFDKGSVKINNYGWQ